VVLHYVLHYVLDYVMDYVTDTTTMWWTVYAMYGHYVVLLLRGLAEICSLTLTDTH
jgi:hypothetical protein